MIPTNVISFINKIVAVDSGGSDENESSVRGLLRNTLINAQDIVTSGSRRNSSSPLSDCNSPVSPPDDKSTTSTTNTTSEKTPSSKEQPGRRAGSCRVCLKSFKPEDYSRICFGCKMKVCEDCASYSQLGENEDESLWSCSVCRRKQQSVQQLIVAQDSQDSLLDVPIVDTLQRRHSDIRISSSNSGTNIQSLGAGLAPPRSPELRRHSDVSPASLKELEKALLKVASEKREEMRWERELEWRQKQRTARSGSSSGPGQQIKPPGPTSPYDRRPSTNESMQYKDKDKRNSDDNAPEPNECNRRSSNAPKPIPAALRTRRKSQVPKQHSYDDEIKNLGKKSSSNVLDSNSAAIPRRASAYDVYHKRPDGSLMASGKPDPGRRSSFRTPSPNDKDEGLHIDARRRASCRPPMSSDNEESFSPAVRRQSMKPKPLSDLSGPNDGGESSSPSLAEFTDEERRARRRGSQLPDINAIKAGMLGSPRQSLSAIPCNVQPPDNSYAESLRRQSSLSGEDIKIVIDDVDQLELDHQPSSDVSPVRRVILRRDPNERIHKTRGFGMRVVGGKPGPDGTLYTYIVWTMPGGPAEKAGLRKGDKILELCGIPLMDLSFDEVTSIMDRTGDVIDMVVETQGVKMNESKDDLISQTRKKNPEIVEPHEPVISPTRRKLPKTPMELQDMVVNAANQDQQQKEKDANKTEQISRLQLEFWCKEKKSVLVVSILAADSLPLRDDYYFGGCQPEAFIRLRLIPTTDNDQIIFTDVAEPNQNPIWNTTVELRAENGNVLEKALEVTIWDQRPDGEQVFIGEVVIPEIDLTIDTPVWYRIENPETPGVKKPNQYFPDSPTPSLDGTQRSLSDRDSEIDGGDGTYGFLHPDHAYLAGSRRGSSQSEQLEVEPYQLNRDFSRSLPGSRRSSFQSTQNSDKDIPPVTYSSKGRRRSSCTPRPDPDEILKNLKAVKGELLGRSMSICSGDWRMRRKSSDRRKESKDSVPELAEPSGDQQNDDDEPRDDRKLGPFQLEPRFNSFTKVKSPKFPNTAKSGGNIDLGLELCITKGQLAVKVCSARGLTPSDNPPDTYVKMYLRDGDRLLLKRKTRVVTKSLTPEYNQTLKYAVRDVSDRSLVVMLWERQKGFEHNQGLGSAEIRVDTLKLCEHVTGWYPLFPIQKIGSESNDSP
ncbi:regulating synaptic membrane exocytosis protein 2 isoform X2 [Planococcus citri]|uniref:regulating synaptic membrane exocytosis protein 2 isoform X2 n=1 Tax=Planococcus citri TaxID=170843 RepID=UPI0031F933C1